MFFLFVVAFLFILASGGYAVYALAERVNDLTFCRSVNQITVTKQSTVLRLAAKQIDCIAEGIRLDTRESSYIDSGPIIRQLNDISSLIHDQLAWRILYTARVGPPPVADDDDEDEKPESDEEICDTEKTGGGGAPGV